MINNSSSFPSKKPLPHLIPHRPPEAILKICKEYQNTQSKRIILNKNDKEERIEDDFKRLY